MQQIINLLIIEDEVSQQEIYEDTIARYNEDHPENQITYEIVSTRDEGVKKIKNPDNVYDAAILDLQIGPTENGIAQGNELIHLIKGNLRFPIFIRSGYLNDLSAETREQQNIFLNFYVRGEVTVEQLLDELVPIVKTGVTRILNRKGKIEEFIHKIFWEHLTTSMPYWINKNNVESALLRYTLAHIQEYLELNDNGTFDDYHTPEFYIKPVIKSHSQTVFTGDIIKSLNENNYYIVLTPACDLVIDAKRPTPKAKYILIAKIETLEDNLLGLDGNKRTTKKSNIESNREYYLHYLPSLPILFEGGCINFQNLKSIPITDIIDKTKYTVELSLNSAFKKDIIARFSHYYSRQGQPNLL